MSIDPQDFLVLKFVCDELHVSDVDGTWTPATVVTVRALGVTYAVARDVCDAENTNILPDEPRAFVGHTAQAWAILAQVV